MADIAVSFSLKGHRMTPNPDQIAQLGEAFEGLYYPRLVDIESIRAIDQRYGEWRIHSHLHQLTSIGPFSISSFLSQLVQPDLDTAFKASLVSVSGSARFRGLEFLNVGQFCELRAAICAVDMSSVQSVAITAPNSKNDAKKADLIILRQGSPDIFPIQIKATQGKANRVPTGFPVLRDVWKMSFDMLRLKLSELFKTHGPSTFINQ